MADGKEHRNFDDRDYVMELSLTADFALIKAKEADRYGNLTYNKTARNFAPIMAMAAKTTIVQTSHCVEAGDIDPETVATPGIFVDRIIHVENPLQESSLNAQGRTYP